jgi:ATP-dependent RNA helicase DDX41
MRKCVRIKDYKVPVSLKRCCQTTCSSVGQASGAKYLLTLPCDAGSKDQQERVASITKFKQGTADVLCATDVAGKGLDFDGIKHVINYDMPEEIENYVHRIGRTGRRGKRGLATTFVSLKDNSETILLDLKYLLKEAKQKIPAVLMAIDDPMESLAEVERAGHKGCAYCGGLGHRIQNCPKLKADSRSAQAKHSHHAESRLGGEM